VKRAIEVVRSVIPADPYQLLFLCGSLFLFICIQVRCFPLLTHYAAGARFDDIFGSYLPAWADRGWMIFTFFARIPMLFAGGAGLFLCFWPGNRPSRSVSYFVCLPTIAGLALLCLRLSFGATEQRQSALYAGPHVTHSILWVLSTMWSLGPAIQLSLFGLASAIVFQRRLAKGLSTLPVDLPTREMQPDVDRCLWNRILIFAWIAIVGQYLVVFLAGFIGATPYIFWGKQSESIVILFPLISQVFGTAVIAGVAAWAVGGERWKQLKEFLRLPPVVVGFLGVAIPIFVHSIPTFLTYLYDRIHWATYENQQVISSPGIGGYFSLPHVIDPSLYPLLPAAFLEEVIWRGYLQPRFVRRYGVMQGILLIGLIWSSFHFAFDFRLTGSALGVLRQFAVRLTGCTAMSFVFGWMAIRSGSIWPAVFAHTLHNAWLSFAAYTGNHLDGNVSVYIVTLGYAVVGYLLFKYWPPVEEGGEPVVETEPAPVEV